MTLPLLLLLEPTGLWCPHQYEFQPIFWRASEPKKSPESISVTYLFPPTLSHWSIGSLRVFSNWPCSLLLKTEWLQVHHWAVPPTLFVYLSWLAPIWAATGVDLAADRRVIEDQEESSSKIRVSLARQGDPEVNTSHLQDHAMKCCVVAVHREQTLRSGCTSVSGDVLSPPHLFPEGCQKCHYSCQADIMWQNSNLIQQQNILWCSQRE